MTASTTALAPLSTNDATFVVVAGGARDSWRRFQQAFRGCENIAVVRSNAALDSLVEEWRKSRSCVVAMEEQTLPLSEPEAFGECIGYGRLLRVLVLIRPERHAQIETLLRMGCRGFVSPDARPALLRRAVNAVIAGEHWAPRKLLSDALGTILSSTNPRKLTARESEILKLVARGYTNREAAEELCISRETVRWHIRMLYGKLRVHDRRSAAAHARLDGAHGGGA